MEKSTERKTKIGKSSQYQNFEREVDETKTWLAEKLKVATDESYRVRNFHYEFIPFPKSLDFFWILG